MADLRTRFSDLRLLRFAGVGVANTGVHYAVYLSLWLVLPYLAAHCVASLVATLGSYLLNCRFTFRVQPSLSGLLLYPLSTVVNAVLSASAVLVAVEAAGVDSRAAGFVGGVVALPVSFLVSKRIVRKRWRFRLADGPYREVMCAALVAALVVVLGQIPVLANPSFYFSDDSAAQFLPMWHHLGEQIWAGHWPMLLDVDSWMGGNLAAEALFGLWNPVTALDCLTVYWIGDLAVAAIVVKTQFLVLLALGVYLLCREYAAARPAASVVAVAFPVSGFVLYFEAATWAGGLTGLSWLPWAWWALRRTALGRAWPLIAFVFCYLCVSSGDPYGVLGLCVVICALLVESWLSADHRGAAARRLILAGLATALVLPLIFLPLVITGPVTWRSGWELYNSGQLAVGLGDLLNISIPSYLPHIRSFGSVRMSVPGLYFTWFALPLLPWFDWKRITAGWRWRSAPLLVAVTYLVLCLGPSNVWMFRWPLRHTVVLFLALSVVLSVVLSARLKTDHLRMRTLLTVGGLAFSSYLAFSAWPAASPKHLLSLVLVSVLVGGAVWLAAAGGPVRFVAVVLHGGTVCVLCAQMMWFPVNRDVAVYNFPADVARIRADFAEYHGKTVVQIADADRIAPADVASREAWRHLLFGNMYLVAGVPSVVSYTGIGHRAMHRSLCLSYYGSTCPAAWKRLWIRDGTGTTLADRLNADHVVVQRRLVDHPVVPAGWRISKQNRLVTVISRVESRPGTGRVSAVAGAAVLADKADGPNRETVILSDRHAAKARLVFARLFWPGYTATADGRPIPVRATGDGLVSVFIPPGTARILTLTWSPPAFLPCVALAVLGFLIALAASVTSSAKTAGCVRFTRPAGP